LRVSLDKWHHHDFNQFTGRGTLAQIFFRRAVMNLEQFQNLIIGSGVAGKILAWTLAKQGQRTVVVERAMIGGSCPNVACLPSKNVIYSAKAVSLVLPMKGLGVVTGSMQVDMTGVARRKRQMVEDLVKVHLDNFQASGAELIMGEARFTEPKTVHVELNAGGARQLRGERVFINVGTRASIPDVPGLAADEDAVADARVHEGAYRRRRSHLGLHGIRRGSQRVDGRRANGDARGHAIHRAPGRHLHPSDRGRRTARPIRQSPPENQPPTHSQSENDMSWPT
jgi:Pyridine nucleotide-disulphide oxidoreductase